MPRLRIRKDGVLVAECHPAITDPDRIGHSSPYRFVLQYPMSQARKIVESQLLENGVSVEDVAMLLSPPLGKTGKGN